MDICLYQDCNESSNFIFNVFWFNTVELFFNHKNIVKKSYCPSSDYPNQIRLYCFRVFPCQMTFFFITLSYLDGKNWYTSYKAWWAIFEIAYVLKFIIFPSIELSLILHIFKAFPILALRHSKLISCSSFLL